MAALVDASGDTGIATHAFPTTRAGYRALVRWMTSFGEEEDVGPDAQLESVVDRPDLKLGRLRCSGNACSTWESCW